MKKHATLFFWVFVFLYSKAEAQSTPDSVQIKREFVSLDEALKNPENVYRIDLSDQNLKISDTIWSKFTNLQYLSLKDDHLKEIPEGIGYLKNLEVLDLSGNDFKVLPSSFSNLTNLQELYLNDDKYFKFSKNIPILSTLPNLRSLHIENDGLRSLPKDIVMLSHLESLYLNNNKFRQLPPELNGLKNLQYLDFHDNKLPLPAQDIKNQNFGYKIRF